MNFTCLQAEADPQSLLRIDWNCLACSVLCVWCFSSHVFGEASSCHWNCASWSVFINLQKSYTLKNLSLAWMQVQEMVWQSRCWIMQGSHLMLRLLHFLLFEVSFLIHLRSMSFCGERISAVNIVNCCIASLMYETMIVLYDLGFYLLSIWVNFRSQWSFCLECVHILVDLYPWSCMSTCWSPGLDWLGMNKLVRFKMPNAWNWKINLTVWVGLQVKSNDLMLLQWSNQMSYFTAFWC